MKSVRTALRFAPWLALVSIWTPISAAQTPCPGSDEVVLDCNGNGRDDYCDIASGTSADANTNAIPDECDFEIQLDPFSGFETQPTDTPVDGLDLNNDGHTWKNASISFRFQNTGCNPTQPRAIKGISTNPPAIDQMESEFFHTAPGSLLNCGAHMYDLAFDLRSEATLSPRTDWQIRVRDSINAATVVLIHLASTRSNLSSVTGAQGGNGRGRVLVGNPAEPGGLIRTDRIIPQNACYRIRVVLDNNAPAASAVKVFIDGILRQTLARIDANARRVDYIRVEQVVNGAGTPTNFQFLALDNLVWSRRGAPLDLPDCNANCVADEFDISEGTSLDCPASLPSVPDECEPDCNTNGTPDACDLAMGASPDCNTNGQPDECDIAAGTSRDCNANGIPEECDIATGSSLDCNTNGHPDGCDLVSGTSQDCNGNDIPDECDVSTGFSLDCNGNQFPDECDVGEVSLDWRIRPALGPRSGHAMAYDSARGRTVLFGGLSALRPDNEWWYRYLRDLWEWDGVKWTLMATDGPSARSGAAITYDSGRGVAVVYGGFGRYGVWDGTTWEWNGADWVSQSVAVRPSPRSGHAMCYDSARGVVVLFGGSAAGYLPNSETWEWDGAAWTLRSSAGPSPRSGHAMTYDASRTVSVIFGGTSSTSPYYNSETWEWDGAVWALRASEGPDAALYEMTYDDLRGVCVLAGGDGEPEQPMQTWEWDGQAWTNRSSQGPAVRGGHGLVYDSTRHVVVLFGGSDADY